jgi:hypothetical protein
MSVRLEPLPCADPLSLGSLESDLVHRWLVWDAWTAGRRRVDLHPLVLEPAAHREAIAVASSAWELVRRGGERALEDADERARYRFHPDVERLAEAARAGGDRGAAVRVDLLLREDGHFLACEVNADCPGGYNETVALPRLARQAGLGPETPALRDPTTVAPRLADRLVAASGGPGSPRGLIALVFATGYAEDLQVCAFLERLVRERGGRTVRVSPTALAASREGDAVVVRGQRVSVLYRFYPLEYMAEQRNVDVLVRATETGALASVTSFASIFAQSKLAMARAFALDPAAAGRTFPETVALADIGRDRIAAERERWVVKRDLSRVGDHVFVGALLSDGELGEVLTEIDLAEASGGQAWIAQRYVPQAPIATPWGPRLVTLGVYLLDGAFAGYFARLSPTSLCSHDALVLPVFVREEVS